MDYSVYTRFGLFIFLGKNRERSALRSSIRNKQNDNKNSILWMHLILL